MPRADVFISYSHKDKKWREELERHLKPYVRNGIITSWSDQQIEPGSQWFEEIRAALTNSGIAVLLVSPDFLDSDFIHEHELGPLLKKAEQGGVKILWIPVRASAYKQTPLKHYQALLDPSRPLAAVTKAKRDQAWVEICEKIQGETNRIAGPSERPNRSRPRETGEEEAVGASTDSFGPALKWDNNLGHIYREERSVIYTQGITLTLENIGNSPAHLIEAHLESRITNETAQLKVESPDGLLSPSETTPVPPSTCITLRAEFNLPSGIPAQEFIRSWGQITFSIVYDHTTDAVIMDENRIRALYASFRPNPLEPPATRASLPQATEPPDSERQSLFELAARDPREAMKKSWELLAKDILSAGNIGMGRSDPDSPAISIALAKLESGTTYPFELILELKEFQATARKLFNQSRWAYDPSESEARAFIIRCEAVRRQLR